MISQAHAAVPAGGNKNGSFQLQGQGLPFKVSLQTLPFAVRCAVLAMENAVAEVGGKKSAVNAAFEELSSADNDYERHVQHSNPVRK